MPSVRPRDRKEGEALQHQFHPDDPADIRPVGKGGSYGPGRAVIESCATKVVLKQDQAASSTLREAFNLSEAEERFVTNAKIGQGLLMTQELHIPMHNYLSEAEQRLFTRLKDITG